MRRDLLKVNGLGLGPSDVPPPLMSERDKRIAEMYLEAHAAEMIAAIEAGAMGTERRRQWRRFKSVADKFWPWVEKRKARKT